jgi:glutamate-1-semialdehyde 2,1-aminomutase
MKPEPPVDYRSAYMNRVEQQRINQLVNHMFDSGFMMINTCTAALSTAMNREHVDLLVDSLSVGFQQLERSI